MDRTLTRYFWLLITAVLLTAALLRLAALPTVPPGLHYDEAANGLLASEIAWEGKRPIFIASYTGKEVLFFYLAGGLMRLVGSSSFTLRLTAAFVGLLTVAATYWLGRELRLSRRVALLAALLLATSFWHIVFSRLGFRAITQPLLQALTVAALLRGWRRDNHNWLLLSGLFLGLTAYTYLAARLFPLLLGVALLPLLLRQRHKWRLWVLWGAVGLLVLLPLLLYFRANPDAFWVRIGQVAPSETSSVWSSYLKSLGMFFWQGDPYERFNIPQRPLFNPFWAIFLLLGWGRLLWRRPQRAEGQTAVLLLLLTPFLMILPTALAIGEITPSNLRAIGLIPFVFYLPAIGFDWLLLGINRLSARLPTTAVSLPLLLLWGVASGWQSYFNVWATDPSLFYAADGDLTAVSRYLDTADLDNKTIYVAALHYQHPTIAFLSRRYEQVNWLPNSQALPLSQTGTAVYIYPHNSPAPTWAEAILPPPTVQTADFTVYELTNPPPPSPPNPVTVNFGNAVTLLGYELETAVSGHTLPLTLYWRIDGIPPAEVKPFVHLEDAWGHRWSQVEPFVYPVAQWQVGTWLVQRVTVSVPDGAPPGGYRLRMGLFAPADGARLSRLDEQGRYAGDAFVLAGAMVLAGEPPAVLPTPPSPLGLAALPELTLLGFERGKTAVTTGERLDVALWWQATAPLPPLTTRLELVRPDQTGRILLNTQPVHGSYPFANWQTPQFVIDRSSERIPDSFQTGNYRLQLRLLDGAENSLITADLGPLDLTQAERLFTPPPTDWPLDATFGNEIKLLGYNLNLDQAHYRLDLVWQANSLPSTDYTVFVHLLNQDGSCCIWQQDVAPLQGQYPTTRWVAEEVVVDSYLIPADLPAGEYVPEVGLYIAETGQRLQVVVPGQPNRDLVYLRPFLLE